MDLYVKHGQFQVFAFILPELRTAFANEHTDEAVTRRVTCRAASTNVKFPV